MSISNDPNKLFNFLCKQGFFEDAQKLYNTRKVNIYNEHHDPNRLFNFLCKKGFLEDAQELYKTKKVNISNNEHEIYLYACMNNKIHLAKWFNQISPNIYELDYDDEQIISYRINHYIYLNPYTKYKNVKELCSICYENYEDINTNCDHIFCKDCIYKHLEVSSIVKKCPYCRQELTCFYDVKISKKK